MKTKTTGMKAAGLCALVIAAMAVSAGSAQAEESGGKWTFINASGELKELPEESFGLKADGGSFVVLSTIAGMKVEFICAGIAFNGAKLLVGGTALGSIRFNLCTTKLNGTTSAACKPNAEGKESGVIKTLKLLGTLLLHKLGNGTKDKIILLEPDTGSTAFAHVEMGEECPVGESAPIGGKLALLDCQGAGETHQVEHLFTEFEALTHLWVFSDTAEHAVRIDGSILGFLSGANVGKKWAMLWN